MTAGRLLTAAEGGDDDSVRALLDEGSDVEETDSYGNTALILAAANGHVGTIRILLAEGADVNASRKDGMTPLILGTFSAHADVVRTLLAADASLNATDSLGMTALQWAKSKGLTEIEHILSDDGVVDPPSPAGNHGVERPAVTDSVGELRLGGEAEAADTFAEDTLDHAEMEQAHTPAREPASPLRPESNPLPFDSAADTPRPTPVEPSNIINSPSAELLAASPQLGRQGDEELHEFAVAEDMISPKGSLAANRLITPTRAGEYSRAESHTHETEVLPTPADKKRNLPLPHRNAYRFWYVRIPLTVMLGAFIVTWFFLLFIDATSPPVRTTSEALPNGGEATSRAGGAGGEVAKQPGALTRDEARGGQADGGDALLTTALGDWAAATNNQDIGKLMVFYAPELSTFYKLRKASSSTVRREKLRLFAEAQILNIRVSEPAIKYSEKPFKATIRFRKNYTTGGRQKRPAGVIQELVWQKTSDGWKIVSERDIQTIK